jgi:hypothetical protein
MPRYPAVIGSHGDSASGRFNTRPAIAIATGEQPEDDRVGAARVLREEVGEWILEPHPQLGQAEAVDGSAGRGASAWIAVVQWLGDAIANNIVDIAVGYGLAKVLNRLREWTAGRETEGKYGGITVSRGAAAALAAADVADHFDESGPLEVEAVEEPSSIAGHDITEISYVGLEPWIVLLRNVQQEVRYVVVVHPQGGIAGRLRVPFLPFEGGYLAPSVFRA